MKDDKIERCVYDKDGIVRGTIFGSREAIEFVNVPEEIMKELKELRIEVINLRHEKRLWLKVCRFERKRQEKFYDMMFIDQKSDFGMYLAAIKELAESEE